MNNVIEMNEAEIEVVAGGPIQWLAIAAGIAAVAAVADSAKKIIEVGEKVHDAVCVH